MAINNTTSQNSSRSSLQVPGNNSGVPSSTRSLRPASPSRLQPGFVVTPRDSRTAITSTLTSGNEAPGPLGLRNASPRPPVKKKTREAPVVLKPKAKPAARTRKVVIYLLRLQLMIADIIFH